MSDTTPIDKPVAGVEQFMGHTLIVWPLDSGMVEFTHVDDPMPYLLDPSVASERVYWELLAWAARMT